MDGGPLDAWRDDAPPLPDAWHPVCAPTTRPTGVIEVAGSFGAGKLAPIAAEDLCAAFGQAVCAADCGCERPTCADDARADCEGMYGAMNPPTRAAIASGEVTYDALAAARAIAGIDAAVRDCAHQPRIVLADLLAATGAVFGPRISPSGSCNPEDRWPCERGSRCVYDFDFAYRCEPSPAGNGGECLSFGFCSFRWPPELRCGGATCDLGAPPGAGCPLDRCATTYCQGGYCGCELAVGEACSQDEPCASGHCRDGVCSAALLSMLGGACTRSTGCGEGVCVEGRCVAMECWRPLWHPW
jgi:hypothetical protein